MVQSSTFERNPEFSKTPFVSCRRFQTVIGLLESRGTVAISWKRYLRSGTKREIRRGRGSAAGRWSRVIGGGETRILKLTELTHNGKWFSGHTVYSFRI